MSVFNWNAKNTKDMANNPEGENAMNSIITNNNEDQSNEAAVLVEAVQDDDFARITKDIENLTIDTLSVDHTIRVPEGGVPAGDYLATIKSASHVTHKTGNYPMVTVEIKISAGDFKDLPLTKYFHLKSTKAIEYFKKEMLSIGFIIKGPSDLGTLCSSLPRTNVMANVVFNDSGNRIIYLKSAALPKKVASVDAASLW
jgi:hypothetical protein